MCSCSLFEVGGILIDSDAGCYCCSQLGVTKPITLAGPSEREIQATDLLMDELRKQNTFESEEEARIR